MRFAERTVRMRAAGIEIPQRGVPQAGRGRRPAHHALHDALGLAVAVSRIESGSRLVTDYELLVLTRIFHVSADWLIGADKNPPRD